METKVWNICDYGACFSDQLQTGKIQKAIDDCFLAGGGRVLIPCGVYVTGSLRIRSHVELYLESGAILKGSRNPEDYFGYREDKLEPVTIEEVGKTPKTGRSAISTSRWSNGLFKAMMTNASLRDYFLTRMGESGEEKQKFGAGADTAFPPSLDTH